ncbi:GntR family transcriptional regulator [Modestobacter sp. VKM Ac-2985]|uniref:GntR family transcriptional regulator n=1 Tax=Modestobacter sp. VKM Ac-2985 TaxID=3004139 RepID=UPI0022ABA670|nr:GntR family transcriptional regulator [Modestobacter sp. VKM Ac-2985]MCZ2836795.1 GntR family transcriptional regulator [Modestobacter sp. VKM Ac-2985]
MSRQRPPAPWVAALASARDTPSQALVLEELRTAILAGLVRPGAPIPVDDVAARFSLSRIPVREALKTLVAEGLVEHEVRGAYVVARLSRAELAELYVVRASLEAAAQAAAVPLATPQDVAVAAAALRELEAATAAGGAADHHRWSRRFHLALIAPCQMHRLLQMFERAWNVTEPGRPMSHASAAATAALAADHVAMLDAFAAGDAAALTQVTGGHYARLQEIVAGIPAEG